MILLQRYRVKERSWYRKHEILEKYEEENYLNENPKEIKRLKDHIEYCLMKNDFIFPITHLPYLQQMVNFIQYINLI